MQATIIINTQYYENYNVGPEGFGATPHWKPKGPHQFQIEIHLSQITYSTDDVSKVFQALLDNHETIAEKFEYISHEIQWQEPTVLGTEEDFIKTVKELNPELA